MTNYKTYKSLDLSTLCPKQKSGNPCEYCYVHNARKFNYRAKRIYERIPYTHEILRMRTSTISKLNKMGGLRLFAFGDYESWMNEDIKTIIDDAEKKGLLLKAITKQLDFLQFCDKIFTNLSFDLIGGIPSFPVFEHENLKFRVMVRNEEEVKAVYKEADILTPYHGPKLNSLYRPKEAKKASIHYAKEKTCGIFSKCINCDLKCGRIKK